MKKSTTFLLAAMLIMISLMSVSVRPASENAPKVMMKPVFDYSFNPWISFWDPENPCPSVVDPKFVYSGSCVTSFSVLLKNDVSNTNPKPVKVQVFNKITGALVAEDCFIAGTTPGGELKELLIPAYDCSQDLQWIITRYTASNGQCQGGICGNIIALPLDITKFAGKKQGQSVVLDWTATKELIEDGESFTVERSTDARNFVSITSINASSQKSQYSYTDNPGTGKVFYRLALNNNNGGRKYSNIISVATDARGPKIETPINSGIVRLTMLSGTQAVIANHMGQTVQTFLIKDDFVSVNLKDFSPGVYSIRCINISDGRIVIAQQFIR